MSTPEAPRRAEPVGAWGMLLLIATEASLFAYLLFSYFYLASMHGREWFGGEMPSLRLALPNTVILLASSGAMWVAESGIRRGRQTRLRAGLLAAFALGVLFLVIQGMEYRSMQLTPRSGAFGSLFFTITGFHGAHVLIGLLMMAFVQLRAWLGHFGTGRHLAVTNTARYWHFVDLVWLCVFFTLYLTPRFG